MGPRHAPIPLLPSVDVPIRRELQQLYDELDKELSALGAACTACGDCCRFTAFGHELWLTSLELTVLLDAAGQGTGASDGTCPFQSEGRCTARDGRALGCRIFHCRLDPSAMERLHETFMERLRELHARHDLDMTWGEFLSSLSALR